MRGLGRELAPEMTWLAEMPMRPWPRKGSPLRRVEFGEPHGSGWRGFAQGSYPRDFLFRLNAHHGGH